ncbi:hemerythrin domain-containing protein [Streptomyces sp. AJS327]|uniref:hemerythrin domain-containing protein n=1 Tax=Streptomyces sp. AJS327 TaxID=2545265 RepID=UPI0015DF77E8|nr:hemerythrin domain-containing protein [Streptomyces sp. AJS327]MBA0053342.1 hemerythrin domain-containing protein [Streptomyces sp. AJS327]
MNQPTADLPRAHQTMLLSHRAMVRDLGRSADAARTLARTGDPTRAAALRTYTSRLTALIEHHHQGEDDFLWPALRERDADPAALDLLTAEHAELNEALHTWGGIAHRLGEDDSAPAELAERAGPLRELLATHAGDEERELLDRLAPALDARIWKGFETHMRKTAPGWTLRFMPPWLASVARPEEKGGIPAPPLARLFRGSLEKNQRAAFGEDY